MSPLGRPLSDAFGIDLDGWDEGPEDVLAALDRHHVVRVRGVDWDEPRQLEITASIGAVVGRMDGETGRAHPNVRLERGVDLYTDRWHADLSWSLIDAISVLVCTDAEIEPESTQFLDTSVAIEQIDGDLMDRISDRTVLHDLRQSRRRRPAGTRSAVAGQRLAAIAQRVRRGGHRLVERRASWPEGRPRELVIPRQEGRGGTRHPLLDRCGRTGTPFLRIGDHAWLVSGLGTDESQDLLSALHEAIERPHFIWQQDWKVGDAVFYDNRMVLHRRGGVAGTPPGRVLRRTLAEWPDRR